MRAITTCMHPPDPQKTGFKRQVVFRISTDDWPLLQQAAQEHGSIQAAVLAGLRALAQSADHGETRATEPARTTIPPTRDDRERAGTATPDDEGDPREEIPA